MKVLGTMLAHSIVLDEVGFPCLSPVCYCLLAEGEESALSHVTLTDVPADASYVVNKVSIYMFLLAMAMKSTTIRDE